MSHRPQQSPQPGTKPRVLVVEDEFIIADMIRGMLEDIGCEVLGPIGTVSDALKVCQSIEADAVVLDLILHEQLAYPVAEVLASRGIPFGFATGRDTADAEGAWQQLPFLGKPYSPGEVQDFLNKILPNRLTSTAAASSGAA